MLWCAQCKAQITADATTCPACGFKFGKVATYDAVESRKTVRGYMVIALLLGWAGELMLWLTILALSFFTPDCPMFAPTNRGACRVSDELAAIFSFWGLFMTVATAAALAVAIILILAKRRRANTA